MKRRTRQMKNMAISFGVEIIQIVSQIKAMDMFQTSARDSREMSFGYIRKRNLKCQSFHEESK